MGNSRPKGCPENAKHSKGLEETGPKDTVQSGKTGPKDTVFSTADFDLSKSAVQNDRAMGSRILRSMGIRSVDRYSPK